MASSSLSLSSCLKARLLVVAAVVGMTGFLLACGYSLGPAAAVSCLAAIGAVEVAHQLTAPFPALGVRVSVVLVVVVLVVTLICLQHPWIVAVGVVLGTAVSATAIARRLTGSPYRFPRVSF